MNHIGVCVYVCVCGREREMERMGKTNGGRNREKNNASESGYNESVTKCLSVCLCVNMCSFVRVTCESLEVRRNRIWALREEVKNDIFNSTHQLKTIGKNQNKHNVNLPAQAPYFNSTEGIGLVWTHVTSPFGGLLSREETQRV